MEDKSKLFKKGKKTSIFAGVGTLLFALIKGVAGLLSGSIVLTGDAIHSAADSFSAFLVWVGLKISQKDPTEKFPYGFYKVENVTSLLVSFLILFAGFSIARKSISKLSATTSLNYPIFAVGVAILDAAVMFTIGTYEIKEGEKINSQSLVADGRESRMHLLSSSIVLIGLVSSILSLPYIESVAGILISLFIFHAGFESGRDAIFALLDVSPSKEMEKKIIEVIGSVSGIEGYGGLKLRKAGPFVFGECTIKIRKFVDVDRANEISNKIEEEIKDKINRIDSFSIKVEPYETDKIRAIIPVKDSKGDKSTISEHFGRAKNFALVSLDKEKEGIENVKIIPNEFKDKEIRAGLAASKSLTKEKIDALITKEIGDISFHTMRDNLIDIYKSKGKKVEDITQKFMKENLERLSEPTREKE